MSWQDISTMPRDTYIDTCGVFEPRDFINYLIDRTRPKTGEKIMIRFPQDNISNTTVYPLTTTFYEYKGMTGDYTRIYWMPAVPLPTLPQPPSEPSQAGEGL